MRWVRMVTYILFAAISNDTVASRSVDRMIGMLLSDEVVIGEVVSVRATSAGNPIAEFRIQVAVGSTMRDFYLSNPQQEPLVEVSDERRVVLISIDRTSEHSFESILWSPRIGVYEASELTEAQAAKEIAAGRHAADRFISENAKCPTELRSIIGRLSGRHAQGAIEKLYSKRPLSAAAFSCLVSALHSTKTLAIHSFKPPYHSQEGVYHHGLETTGDLVAILLPHLTGVPIYPPRQPLDLEGRQHLFFAWAYWGYRNYGMGRVDPL